VREPPEFVAHCLELLRPAAPAEPRRMFGAWGLFAAGRMFALVVDETLWLKADDMSRAAFEAEGLERFFYEGRGGRVGLPYWQAPPDAMDDPHALRPWALAAIDAALRSPETAKARKGAAMAADLLNLGPKSGAWLAEIGIHTPADLRREGAATAYARVKARHPKEASRNLLWALHGALSGERWDRLAPATKARLEAEAATAAEHLESKGKPVARRGRTRR
jgi:DNA transformation protein